MEMIRVVGLEGHENKFAQSQHYPEDSCKRVSLARNLVYSSQILLLDEATGAWIFLQNVKCRMLD